MRKCSGLELLCGFCFALVIACYKLSGWFGVEPNTKEEHGQAWPNRTCSGCVGQEIGERAGCTSCPECWWLRTGERRRADRAEGRTRRPGYICGQHLKEPFAHRER